MRRTSTSPMMTRVIYSNYYAIYHLRATNFRHTPSTTLIILIYLYSFVIIDSEMYNIPEYLGAVFAFIVVLRYIKRRGFSVPLWPICTTYKAIFLSGSHYSPEVMQVSLAKITWANEIAIIFKTINLVSCLNIYLTSYWAWVWTRLGMLASTGAYLFHAL